MSLKVGAPVLLTVNISDRLVNGLIGSVRNMESSLVTVYFHDIKEDKCITPHRYFQVVGGKNIFVCSQIPLLLAFALTIHKCQAMTLNSLWLDWSGAFDADQVSVALGQVLQENDITVVNFRLGLHPPHPSVVNNFYGTPSMSIDPEFQCCRGRIEGSTSVNVSAHNLQPQP